MLLIDKFSSYRDGGTVAMKCRIGGPVWKFYFESIEKHFPTTDILGVHARPEVEICMDERFDKKPTIWLGYPDKDGSFIIEDESIINMIIEKVKEHKKLTNHKMDNFINYKENLRDWKINETINK